MDFSRFNQAQAQASVAQVDQGLRTYMLSVYNYMAAGLALTGIVAYLVAQSPALVMTIASNKVLFFGIVIAQVGMVVYFSARVMNMSFARAQTVFWAYAALTGLTFSVYLLAFTGASVARVFFITASIFGMMSIYGYTTKKDLTGVGNFLMIGFIGILVATLVNLFLQSSALHYAISAIGVIIFTGLIAYDTQRIRQMYYQLGGADEQTVGKVALMGALSLYLDFINLFVMLMQFLGDRR